MIVTDEMLAEWQAIADAATPERWDAPYDPEAHVQALVLTADGEHVCDAYDNTTWSGDQCRANAKFIATARTAVPALITEVRRERTKAERLRASVEDAYVTLAALNAISIGPANHLLRTLEQRLYAAFEDTK